MCDTEKLILLKNLSPNSLNIGLPQRASNIPFMEWKHFDSLINEKFWAVMKVMIWIFWNMEGAITIHRPRCNGYCCRKWTRRHEFKSWTRLTAFHIALIPLGKVWSQLFSLQLWVNSRTDWVLQPWWGN